MTCILRIFGPNVVISDATIEVYRLSLKNTKIWSIHLSICSSSMGVAARRQFSLGDPPGIIATIIVKISLILQQLFG